MGNFNHTDFDRFVSNFSKMSVEFESWLNAFLMNEGLRFIAEVQQRTPKDTGALQAAWKIESVTRSGDTLYCWFINSMYYATFVEYGHAKPYRAGATEGSTDWVDGYFMMTVSLDSVERKMPARFNRELKAYLIKLGAL